MDPIATIEAYRSVNQEVREIALSPTGDRLAVGLADGVVEIWDVGEPMRRQRRLASGMLEGPGLWINKLVLGTQELFLAWPDNYVERWDLADAAGPQKVQQLDHLAKYRKAALGPASDLLALGESSGIVRLWCVSEGRFVKTIGERLLPSATLRELTDLAFSPDGKLLAVGSESVHPNSFEIESSTLSIWDVNSGQRLAEFKARDNLERSG